MQPVTVQEQTQYASLGWRFAAVLVDTLVLFGLAIIGMTIYIVVLTSQGKLDPNDPASVQSVMTGIQSSRWLTNVAFFAALFVYYAVLEAILGASVGKLVFHMRVTMRDGSKPTGAAVLVRNLVRLPEAWLLYLPAGISCLASPRRERLGDHAARTVVVRRQGAPAAAGGAAASPGGTPGYAPPAPAAPAAPAGWPVAPVPASAAAAPSLAEAVDRLKTAALALRGAHVNYLRFSERELAGGPAPGVAAYSEEYVSAWFTLADAVPTLREAHVAAADAAAGAATTLAEVCARQPDLAHLLRELAPYLTAVTDEEIHEAYLAVARWEATPS